MPSSTRQSLIVRISDSGDDESWAEFVRIYGPFIYAIGRRRGLQDADACDLVQDVMREVARSIPGYEPSKGRFRSWLGVITRRMTMRILDNHRQPALGTGGSTNIALLSGLSSDEAEADWEQAHRQQVFRWAAERVRRDFNEATWRAFWLTAVEGVPAQEAAEACGMTVSAVYMSKSRVTSRIRERVAGRRDDATRVALLPVR